MIRRALPALLLGLAAATGGAAQDPDSLPIVESVNIQGNQFLDPATLLFYVSTKPGERYDERRLKDDFRRLWGTNFLDNLWVEVLDEPYDNGVIGKRVIFNMEERPRVKIVDYTGSSKVERTKVDEKMKELGVALRLDSFLDEGAVRRVKGIIQDLMSEKGFQFAEITSNGYWDWYARVGALFFLSQAAASAFAATFKDFPPIQKPNSFTIDDAIAKLSDAQSGAS